MSDDVVSLELESRNVTGKGVKRLRAAGTVPAVIHDHGKESLNVQAPYLAMYRTYQRAGKHHPVQITAGSKKFTALIKSATFEPKKNMLTHVVFNAVDKNQKVEAEVPIKPRYADGEDSAPAERASLIVLEQLDAVEVRAVPDKLPDVLEYDAEKLVAEGDFVTVADLNLPDGVELADPEMAEHPVATVVTPASLQAANDAAGGTAELEAPEATAEEGEGEAPAEGAEPAATDDKQAE
jgi:ribosomal protein bL25 (Ctc-form)